MAFSVISNILVSGKSNPKSNFCRVCGSVVHGPFVIEPVCLDCCMWADEILLGVSSCL